MGSPTLKGTETLFTSRTCHETHNYIVCTCNTLQPFSPNDSKLISVESLHGHSNAIQVSHTVVCHQWDEFVHIWRTDLSCWSLILLGSDRGPFYGPDRHPQKDAKGRRGLPMAGRHLFPLKLPTLQRRKWHCRKHREWPKQCQREETVSPGPVPKCLGPPREEMWAWCQ